MELANVVGERFELSCEALSDIVLRDVAKDLWKVVASAERMKQDEAPPRETILTFRNVFVFVVVVVFVFVFVFVFTVDAPVPKFRPLQRSQESIESGRFRRNCCTVERRGVAGTGTGTGTGRILISECFC